MSSPSDERFAVHAQEMAATPLKVLIVEDSEADAELLLLELKRGGFDIASLRVSTEAEVRHAFATETWDLVISDYSMPNFDGMRCLQICREFTLNVPFILMSGSVGEEIAVEAMKAGAHDYIMKDRITRLVPAIQRELREAAVRRDRHVFMEQIQFMAYHDPVTRLPNQRLFLDQVEAAIDGYSSQTNKLLILAVPEIARFKEIRTTLTQADYDELVDKMAGRIAQRCKQRVALARIDEYTFALLVEADYAHLEEDIARDILAAFAEPYEMDPFSLHLDVNVGMAVYGLHANSANELLRNATVAASQARDKRQPHALYSATDDHSSPDNLLLLGQLREAIRGGQLRLHYQPIIDLRNNRRTSVEALVRWQHPTQGLMLPAEFLMLAESSNLISPLTAWVVDAAFRQWRAWRDADVNSNISINLSMRNIQDKSFVPYVARQVRELGVEPEHLVFEVTESGIMTDPAVATEVLAQLHGLGFKIAIDDFGTGYSSLAYLQQLPVDDIKVDRNFVVRLTESDRDRAIVNAVLDFAVGLGKSIVAEGVENAPTLDALRSMGCQYAQGYHISRPLEQAAAARWLTHAG
jgi:diguanylate cyclase (GGDEF)-like protein